jgi:hypothetical protein
LIASSTSARIAAERFGDLLLAPSIDFLDQLGREAHFEAFRET